MEEYYASLDEMLKLTSISRDDYFDYSESPSKDEFNDVFLFYQEALRQNEYYGIVPGFIYFNNYRDINAKASKHNSCYVISINAGTIISLLEVFNNEAILRESSLDKHIYFQQHLDSSLSSLIYQNALHFTFYHEMAHLIQNSAFLQAGLYEQAQNNGYLERRHVLELDADEFSALSIGAHTVQYANNTFGKEVTLEHYEKLLTVVCISSMLYVLSFQTNKEEIYYKERSHPHPTIRITRIIFVIIGYSNDALRQMGIEVQLDTKKIVDEAIELASELSLKMFGQNLLDNYKEYVETESDNIRGYIREMNSISKDDKTLAVQKWNVLARLLHK